MLRTLGHPALLRFLKNVDVLIPPRPAHSSMLHVASPAPPCVTLHVELACLTLYLAYEKKRGKESCWYHFIKELDRMQGRGSQVGGLEAAALA